MSDRGAAGAGAAKAIWMKQAEEAAGDSSGTMEVSLPKALINSFSRFGSSSSGNTTKAELPQRYHLKIEETMKVLNPVFEEVNVSVLASDEKLNEVLNDLDATINEAKELIEGWHQMMSKVYFVMQIESVITKLRASALETCQLINTSLADNSSSTCVENCMQKIQQIHDEQTSYVIKEAIRAQVDQTVPRSEHLEKISKSLCLSSNRELLMEAVALDKLKAKVGRSENHAEIEGINQLITIIKYMHDCHVEIKQLHSINRVPIPPDFCCPLSLELMSDPVIVASGQTYERAFIKQWLDQGFNVCPKTRQTLGHSYLIPNYTVKALIANWCESNDIKLPNPINSMNLNLPSIFHSLSDSSVNGSIVSHSSQSPRGNCPMSPDTSVTESITSNGVHQDGHLHEKLTSPSRHPVSLGSSLHISNGCEANRARRPLVNSDGEKESSLEERHVGSGSQTSNQKQDHSQPSLVDEQFQGHSRSASASSAVSNNGYLQGAGDASMVSRVSSDIIN